MGANGCPPFRFESGIFLRRKKLFRTRVPLLQRSFMDYRAFLQGGDRELVLPYFGGDRVCDAERAYRLKERPAPGWYRFREQGRFVEVAEALDEDTARTALEDHADLKEVSGHFYNGRFVGDTFQKNIFGIDANEPPERFAPITARVWYDGHYIFTGIGFESEAEGQVRDAFEEGSVHRDGRGIDHVKGVVPSLASAYAAAVFDRELQHQAAELARLRAEEEAYLRREAERRAVAERELEELVRDRRRRDETFDDRVIAALAHTGAELVDWRSQGGDQAIVKYRFGGEKYECVVDRATLQILDAGICLDGADQELNLSSLPSAVREAIATHQLHVYRRG